MSLLFICFLLHQYPEALNMNNSLVITHIYRMVLLHGSSGLSGSEATAGIIIYYYIYFQSNKTVLTDLSEFKHDFNSLASSLFLTINI